jgi:hypothetical protein
VVLAALRDRDVLVLGVFLDLDEPSAPKRLDDPRVQPTIVPPLGVLYALRVVAGDEREPLAPPVLDQLPFRDRLVRLDVIEDRDVFALRLLDVVLRERLRRLGARGDRPLLAAGVRLRADVVRHRAGHHTGDHPADRGHLRARREVDVDVVLAESIRHLGDGAERAVQVEDVTLDRLGSDPRLPNPVANLGVIRRLVDLRRAGIRL